MRDLIDTVQTLNEFLRESGFVLDESELVKVSEHSDKIEVGIGTIYALLSLEDGTARVERSTSVVLWRVVRGTPKKLETSITAEVRAYGEKNFLGLLHGMLKERSVGDDKDTEGFNEFQEKLCSAAEAALKYQLILPHPELLEAALAAGQQDDLIEEAESSYWAKGVFAVTRLSAAYPELQQGLAASSQFRRNLLEHLEETDAGEDAMRAISQLAAQAQDLPLLLAVAGNPDTPEDIRQELLTHPEAAVRGMAQDYLDDLENE